jgi:hypothetical protein
MFPATLSSLENSVFGELGRYFMDMSSVHHSSSGVLHGGAGGSFDVSPNANMIAHWAGLDGPKNVNPDSVVGALIAADSLSEALNDGQKPSEQPSTAPAVNRTPVEPQTIDYLNAELAKHYGMSAETAYQEALANTSYQRAMRDMAKAGLNPAALFGSGKGSGADGVSYVASGTTGSGPFGGTTAKKDNLFSEGAYYGLSAAIGLIGALVMKNPTGYWILNSAAQGAMGAANAGYKSRR